MIPVEKNKEYDVEIESVSGDGNGVAHIDGFTVFVPMCAKGDILKIKIVKIKERYAYGRIEEIIAPSSERCEVHCSAYKRCGGCNLMHIDYKSQLNIKLNAVRDAISRIGGADGELITEIIGMDNPYHYRNKMIFPADVISGDIQFGFYAERSHELIPVDRCMISDEISTDVLRAVKNYMEISKTPVYNEKTKRGVIRRVFIRKGFKSGEIMVVICSADERLRNRDLLIKLLREVSGDICSIVLNINSKPDNLVLGKKNITLWGRDYIKDSLCGCEYKISPHSFFQVNPIQTEILYNRAIQMAELSPDETLLDVYSGIGTISITASKYAKRVIGVEIVGQAVADAKENAKANNADNCEFYAGEAEEIVPLLMKNGFSPDAAIIDPPRKGSDEKTLQALIDSSVDRIVYISCNPSTLARDIKYLEQNGFALRRGIAVDMFPHTSHVETVCLMNRTTCKN